jgi:two-component system, OmpR family, sensor histidine kinase CpxA
MSRLKLPLYSKILAWFALNLVLLVLLLFFFLKAQFGLGLDWMLSGEMGSRIAEIGDSVSYDFSRLPEAEWNAKLQEMSGLHGVVFGLFSGDGAQMHGDSLRVPAEVQPRLIDKRPPSERPPRPQAKRPADAPPKPRFMMRAGSPAYYWAGVHVDLVSTQTGRPLSLLMRSGTVTGGGLFFDAWPWLVLAAVGLLLSALLWMPFVHSITGFIQKLNQAAASIARGKFEDRIFAQRHDELGDLSTSINTMAAQLGNYVTQQRRITADVAHELCSPIARMQMAIGVLEQRGTPEQASYIKRLDAELQHMARLVEEVLTFSKAETLPEREAAETFSLKELIAEIIAREATEVPIQLQIADVQLHTLRAALDRALGNIIRNAVRYASDIEVHAHTEASAVIIRILDRGPGVPDEALSRLFEPFYRPDASRGRNAGGSGLGLAITKRCLEACGGSIQAQKRDGGGLIFECRLLH